jgi:hypothetical protein
MVDANTSSCWKCPRQKKIYTSSVMLEMVDVNTSSMALQVLKKNFNVFVDVGPSTMLEDSTVPSRPLIFFKVSS